jgi:hypothetical protein
MHRPENGHLPVTDLGLREIVQAERASDAATLVVDDDPQQPSGDRLRRLLAWMFPGYPWAMDAMLFDMFSHGR